MSTEGGPPLGAKKQPILPNLPATSRMAVKPLTYPLSHAFCRKEEQKARLRYSAAVPEALPPPASPLPASQLEAQWLAADSARDAFAAFCKLLHGAARPRESPPGSAKARVHALAPPDSKPLMSSRARRFCLLAALCQRGSTSAPALESPPPARGTAPAAALWRQAASLRSARTGARCFCLACLLAFAPQRAMLRQETARAGNTAPAERGSHPLNPPRIEA